MESTESLECNFCKKTFTTSSVLLQHQKRAKYCLEIQGKENKQFKCKYCYKCLVTNERLLTHISICKEKKKRDEEEKESTVKSRHRKEMRDLEKKMEEKEKIYIEKLKEKDEYIQKLEAKLEKFENTITAIASKVTYEEDGDIQDNEKEILIPMTVNEQYKTLVMDNREDTTEYSNITLNNVVITSRPIDHYVNATELCQAGGKKFNDWFRLDTTKELINELFPETGIPVSALVDVKKGGNDKSKQGSWIHPDLSIQLAQWISPKFAIQVSKWIRTLFNKGSVEIDLSLIREKDRDMRIKDHRIKQLENICLSKQRRIGYPE